jgi:membrane protein YqaA with SNARE-associated domain
MLSLLQTSPKVQHHSSALFRTLRHFGAFGLFSLAILDSSPIPTFAGPDILTAILSAAHHGPWFEYAAAATAGSVIGAYLTFTLARRAGSAYLHSKFGSRKLDSMLGFFDRWGTAALAVSTAVPFPSPTSILFAAAGASSYRTRRFLAVVTLCRVARYSLIAFIADRYGRQFRPHPAPPRAILGLAAFYCCRHAASSTGWNLSQPKVRCSRNRAGVHANCVFLNWTVVNLRFTNLTYISSYCAPAPWL